MNRIFIFSLKAKLGYLPKIVGWTGICFVYKFAKITFLTLGLHSNTGKLWKIKSMRNKIYKNCQFYSRPNHHLLLVNNVFEYLTCKAKIIRLSRCRLRESILPTSCSRCYKIYRKFKFFPFRKRILPFKSSSQWLSLISWF